MLVSIVVVEVAAVLLDAGVDTQLRRVDSLDSEVVVMELAVDFAALLAIGSLDPDALDVRSTDDMVPFRVRPAGVLLGQRDQRQVVLEVGLHLGPEVGDAILQAGLELLEGLVEDGGVWQGSPSHAVFCLQDLLLLGGCEGSGGQKAGGKKLHGGVCSAT